MPPLPPDVDDLIESIGKAISIPSTVMFLLLAARRLKGWHDDIVGASRGARRIGRSVYKLLRLRPPHIILALSIGCLVLAAQVVTVGMCYLVGNYLSVVGNTERQAELSNLVHEGWGVFLDPHRLQEFLVTDRVSGTYTALAVLVMWLAWIGSDLAAPGALLIGLPGWIGVGLSYLTGALMLLVTLMLAGIWLLGTLVGVPPTTQDLADVGQIILQYLLPAIFCFMYAYACMWTVAAPQLVRDSWRGRPR